MVAGGANLVEAFERCDFIVGSADVEWRLESNAVRNSLTWLASFARKPTAPNVLPNENLAQALHGMVAIAKAHYAAEGYSEYWPHLDEQLNKFSTELGYRQSRMIIDGPLQSHLGGLFLYALKSFKLRVPSSGQKYVGPITFHAGLPDRSVDGLMRVVLTVVDEKQGEALRLPENERNRIVMDYQPAVHRSVRSIFETSSEEVYELWQSLVRVALAWRKSGDCLIELQELSPFVNPEKVYEFLVDSDRGARIAKTSFSRPEILYDPSEGQIRILLKADNWSEPIVDVPQTRWKPKFRRIGSLLEAICLAPLPSRFSIVSPITGAKEEIHVMFDERRGIWFDGKSGKMVTAEQVDRYGLTPGTWFMLILGEPSQWNVRRPIRSSVSWSFYESGRDWTAWEVEVPDRSVDCTFLEFRYSDIQEPVRIPLVKKPGPRIEFVTQPIRKAMNASAGRFAVFSERPMVRTHVKKDIALNIWKWVDSVWEHTGDLKIPCSGASVQIDIQPGCYRMTEKRGIGREVAVLAYVPGLTIKDPEYDDCHSNVRIVCEIDGQAGLLNASEEVKVNCLSGSLIEICSTTVNPQVYFNWSWKKGGHPPLTFAVEVEGLRWRVTGLSKPDDSVHHAQPWSCEPVFLSTSEGRQDSARLEIHYPKTCRLVLDSENIEKLTEILPAGKLWKEQIRPFVDREGLQIRLDDGEPITVLVISDRLCLQNFNVEKDGQELCFTFDMQAGSNESNHKSLILLAWKIDDPSLSVFEHPLTNEDLENGFLLLLTEVFETHGTTAFAMARKIKKGFGKTAYLIASSGDSLLEPFGIRFEWATGNVWVSSDATIHSWGAILHQTSLEWLEGRGRRESEYRKWVAMAETEADFAWALVLIWLVECKAGDGSNKARTLQIDAFASVWEQEMTKRLWFDSCFLLQVPRQRWRETVLHVFDQGFTLGQGCPDRWKSKDVVGDDDMTVYPFQWIRDIARVSVKDWPAEDDARNEFKESSIKAAERLWQNAEAWGLVNLFKLLPVARGIGQTQIELIGDHHHKIPFQRKIPQSAHDLRESLGIEDLFLDVAIPDQRQGIPQPLWKAYKSEWILEFSLRNDSECCTAAKMICPFPESAEIDRLKISAWIQAWSLLDTHKELDVLDVTLNCEFDQLLRPDQEIGQIQDELLPNLQPRSQLLYGQKVTVPSRTDSSPKAQTAWRMAWIERSLAFENRSRPAVGGGHPGLTKELLETFQRQLAMSLKVWPELMKRTIALAEFLIQIYQTDGIGRAFRQTVDYTEQKAVQTPKIMFNPVTSNVKKVKLLEPKLCRIANVVGAILNYNPKQGLAEILVKHPTKVSIQAAWTQYRLPNADKNAWLAYFTIKEVQDLEKKRIANAGIPEYQWQRLIVKCQLVESGSGNRRWWAEDVHFLPNFDRCPKP